MQPGLQTVESMGCFLECPLMTRIDNDDDGHHHHHQQVDRYKPQYKSHIPSTGLNLVKLETTHHITMGAILSQIISQIPSWRAHGKTIRYDGPVHYE